MDETARLTVNRPSVIFDIQGRETVVIDLATGHYFRLDPPSTELWVRFVEPARAADVVAACENSDDLRPRIDGIVGELTERGLLRPAEPSDGPAGSPTAWRFEGFTLEEFTDLEDILGLDPIHEVDTERGWPHVAES